MTQDLIEIEETYYQDYDTHNFKGNEGVKHFIISILKRKTI
jgi:hypothetical protein